MTFGESTLGKIQKFREYLDYIEDHVKAVHAAWDLINRRCCMKEGFDFLSDDFIWHAINDNIQTHDISKLSMQEFTQYRLNFFPTENELKSDSYESESYAAFEPAWAHHKEANPHHWQNWTKNYAKQPYCIIFVIENVIDWVAMAMKFGGTAKEYYKKNKKDIDIPKWAEEIMYKIFDAIYD